MAMLTGRMEWSLDNSTPAFDGKTEAQFMAQSIADVSRHYTNGLLDQKTVDWLNLAQCLAIVYGGRLVAIRMTPRAKPQRPVTVHETARDHRAAPPPQSHVTPPPINEFRMSGDMTNVGEVAGIGDIAFPDDHPLSPNYKMRMN
jgi:hypothetical protein